MHAALATLIFLLSTVSARAQAPTNYCIALSDLSHNIKTCVENAYFAKAARVCLEKINRDINSQKAQLALLMAANGAAAGSAQNTRIQNNSANLANLQSSIATLTGYAEHARAEVVQYAANLELAGPFSAEQAERMGIAKYLRRFPCFAKNRMEIAGVVTLIDQRLVEFRATAAGTKALEARTTVALKQVDTTSAARPVSNRAPASAGAPVYAAPPPKAKQGPSDISGTDRIGESDRALQKLTK